MILSGLSSRGNLLLHFYHGNKDLGKLFVCVEMMYLAKLMTCKFL